MASPRPAGASTPRARAGSPALRAASAARAGGHSTPRANTPRSERGRSSDRANADILSFQPNGSSRAGSLPRPGSADVARRAMGGSPRIVMSPLHPRRGARGDGSEGPPNAVQQELSEVCRQVAELAPQKFSSVREAFRYLRPDHNGRVSRSQVYYFFRAYGVERVQAERLFGYFGPSENDDIDGHEFIAYFQQQINPVEDPGDENELGTPAPATPASAMNAAPDLSCLRVANEFHDMLEEVRDKAPQKFSHVREALRIVDLDYDGCITRNEMQHFFRAFGIDEQRSDKLFEKMEKGGPGGVNYYSFVQVVAPFLDLPGVDAVRKAPSRPGSARSRPPSASRSRMQTPERHQSSRPSSPTAEDRKECLQNALSTNGSARSRLPQVLQIETPRSARGSLDHRAPASPHAARERPCTPSSERRSCKELPDSPYVPSAAYGRPGQPLSARRSGNTPRLSASPARESPRAPVSARSSGAYQESMSSAHELPCPPGHTAPPQSQQARKGSPQIERLHVMKEQDAQLLRDAKLAEVFKPAPPPASGRHGRRPMGVVAQKESDNTRGGKLESENIVNWANANRDALTSGGHPVATPSRPRRPPSRGRVQSEEA